MLKAVLFGPIAGAMLAAAPLANPAPRADSCPSQAGALPAPPIPKVGPLQRELQRLGTSPASATRRLTLLDQLAGLDHDIDDLPNYRPEAALNDGIMLREQLRRAGERNYSQALYRLGRLQWARGSVAQAEATLLKCSAAAERSAGKASLDYAYCEHWLGVLYNEQGRYAEGERVLRDAAEIRRRALGPKDPSYAYALFTLAAVYMSLGDYPRAEELNQQVLSIREEAFGACGLVVGDSHNNLGVIYRQTRRYEQAVAAQSRALEIRSAWLGPEDALVAQTMNNLGLTLSHAGRYAEASGHLEKSLAIRDRQLGPDHRRTVQSVWYLAQNRRAEGRLAESEPLLRRGLRGALASGDPKLVWAFLDLYRAYHQSLGNVQAATFFGKQAVNTVQETRSHLAELDKSLQRTFVTAQADIYRELAKLLVDQGRLAEAQQVLSMLKEDEAFDYLRGGGEEILRKTRATYTGREGELAGRLDSARQGLAAVGAELDQLELKARSGLSDAEGRRRGELEKLRGQGQDEFDRFLGELMKELTVTASAERNREIGQRNLGDLLALQETLGALGHGAVSLHYLVLDDRVHIILTTPQIQLERHSQTGGIALSRKIQEFRGVLQNPAQDPRPLARDLYSILLGPIERDLAETKAHTLMVSLDGALRYLPFSALHDGKRYVVEEYAISVFTEAAKDKLRDKPAAQWRFSGFGLTQQVPGFDPLPAVREELESIVRKGILPGEIYFDDQFSAAQLRSALDKRFPVLHIASHFVFQPGTEADSFLVLGDGSRLSLAEVRRYRFRDVDLITLSACETAVGGGNDANGREIEGLAVLVQRQGAKGVLATLWPVADASTGMLTQALYRIRASGATTKAEALRQAQLELLRGDYAHPFFWAPFILMGNWL
jgi:CHAT domain-containing protein/Tfp pilus assembly protein PilF